MKSQALLIFVFALRVFALGAVFTTACTLSPQSTILGKWEIEGMNMSFEFQAGNAVRFAGFGQSVTGTYTLTAKNTLDMNIGGRRSRYKAAVIGDTLEMTNERNETLVFKRAKP